MSSRVICITTSRWSGRLPAKRGRSMKLPKPPLPGVFELITRRQFFQMAAAAVAPVVPGVAFASEAAQSDVLQAVIVPEPAGWVAGLNISNPAVIVSVNLFDGLVTYDDAFHAVPQLAQSWDESADRKTITFYLRH